MISRAAILERLKNSLDQERFAHSLRVEKIALELAAKHHVSASQTSLAALLHDCARRYDRPGLLRMAKKLKLKIDPVRRFEPKLFHAEIGRYLAAKEFGVKNQAVLQAIASHTTGRAGMTKLEKVIYLADHIEVDRQFAGIDQVRKLAFRDLDRAIIEFTGHSVAYFLGRGLPFDPVTVETRNDLLLKNGN